MLVLSEDDLGRLLPPLEIIDAVESALQAESSGNLMVPARQHVHWQSGTLLMMPAATSEWLGVKLVSVVPTNRQRGLPVTNGLMVLNESTTGLPLAVMNAAALTAQRTGAVGALGVKYMTAPDTRSIGIVGCGIQGTWQAIFACAVRPIAEVLCFDTSSDNLGKFVEMMRQHVPTVRITPCRDTDELLGRTDLVVAATTSSEPVLADVPQRLAGKHFISIGSYRPSMQELPDSVYRLAGLVAVDSLHACEEAGDLINTLQKRILNRSDVIPISHWVSGKRRTEPTDTTVYKCVGTALFDIYVAQAFLSRARSQGRGLEVKL